MTINNLCSRCSHFKQSCNMLNISTSTKWGCVSCTAFEPKLKKSGIDLSIHDFYNKFCKKPKISISEFICDNYYLGSYTKGGESIWSFCKNHLANIFEENNDVTDIIFHAAHCTGKTVMTFIALAYQMYSYTYDYVKAVQEGKYWVINDKIPSVIFCGINKKHSYDYVERFLKFISSIQLFKDYPEIYDSRIENHLINIFAVSDTKNLDKYNIIGFSSHVAKNGNFEYSDSIDIYRRIAEHDSCITDIIPHRRFCTIENTIDLYDVCPSNGSEFYKPYFVHGSTWEAKNSMYKDSKTFTVCVIRKPGESHIVEPHELQYPKYEYIRVPEEFRFNAETGIDEFLRSNCDIYIPYPNIKRNLSFADALKELKLKGMKIKRTRMRSYYFLNAGHIYISSGAPTAIVIFTEDDVLADDWIAFE